MKTDHKMLYQEVILDHNKKPRNYGDLDNPSHHSEGHNPLCGDHLSLAIHLQHDIVDQIKFHGDSCAICKASASMMTTAVKGKTLQQVTILIEEFLTMATGKLDLNKPNQLGRLVIFSGICNLPTRVKCAILPWHTLQSAFNKQKTSSTET